MRYGELEHAFAAPIAGALASRPDFRRWFLKRTRFQADFEASLLHEEMHKARTKNAENWWRSHWRNGCECSGCNGGQETDLLAVFEAPSSKRFAIHCEVKQPSDSFPAKHDQAGNYAVRARCWITNPPNRVLRHTDAISLLLCSEKRLKDYAGHVEKFSTVITFEEISRDFAELGREIGKIDRP